jgi:glycosyltransferase involved in cell wall biosynthesis
MEKMLFSIIVPVYNSAPYLEECVESLLRQTFSEFEILLIENGSTDNSPELCDIYERKYPCIKTFHIPNGGLSDARNYGVDKASGEYLVFVDSDDFVTFDMLENFQASIQEYPDVQVITSNGKYLTYKEKMYPAQYPETLKMLNGQKGINWVTNFLSKNTDDWNAPGKCFQSLFWKENNFSFKVGRLSEDFQLIYKVLLEAECMTIVDTFYYYRQARPDSIITKGTPKLVLDTLLNLEEWDEYLKSTPALSLYQKELFYNRFGKLYCTSVLSLLYSFPVHDRKALMADAKQYLYFLSISKNSFVQIANRINNIFGFNILCYILHKLRIISKKSTRLKWTIKGSPLKLT